MFPEFTEPRKLHGCGSATVHATPVATREPIESFDMSHPIDQIDKTPTKPLQIENDGQVSSGWATRALPHSLIASQLGPVTLLRLSRPAKRNALDDATIAGIESFFSNPRNRRAPLSCTARGSTF